MQQCATRHERVNIAHSNIVQYSVCYKKTGVLQRRGIDHEMFSSIHGKIPYLSKLFFIEIIIVSEYYNRIKQLIF